MMSSVVLQESAQDLKSQLISLFLNAGMKLHKWTSNSSDFLKISSDQNNQKPFFVDTHSTEKVNV